MLIEIVLNTDHQSIEPSVLDNNMVSFLPLNKVLLFICVMHIWLNLNCTCYSGKLDIYVDVDIPIHMCVCAHTRTHACKHACEYTGHFPWLLLETRSLTELSWPSSPASPLSSPSWDWYYRQAPLHPESYMGSEDLNLGPQACMANTWLTECHFWTSDICSLSKF